MGYGVRHSPILLTLSDRIIQKYNLPKLVNKRSHWQSFKINLEKITDVSISLRTEQQLDQEVQLFVRNI